MLAKKHIAKAAIQISKFQGAKPFINEFFQGRVHVQQETKTNMGKVLSAMVNLAQLSSERIKKIYSSGKLQTFMKGEEDPCTIADIESQLIICGGLRQNFPELTIIGEESIPSYEENSYSLSKRELKQIPSEFINERWRYLNTHKLTIWVDPLDGTSAFNRREPQNTTCLLGVAYEDEPIAGVIIKPFTNEIIWGCRDTGVFYKQKQKWSQVIPRKLDKLIITSPYLMASRFLKYHKPIAGSGSRSWEVILGKASVQWQESRNSKKWDICAADALIRTLGGQMTDIQGRRYKYNSTVNHVNEHGVFATLFDHDEALKYLREQKAKLNE